MTTPTTLDEINNAHRESLRKAYRAERLESAGLAGLEPLPLYDYEVAKLDHNSGAWRDFVAALLDEPDLREVTDLPQALQSAALALEIAISRAAGHAFDLAVAEAERGIALARNFRRLVDGPAFSPDYARASRLVEAGIRCRDAAQAMAAPRVGGAASFRLWTDVEPATVVEIRKNGREVVLRIDRGFLENPAGSSEADALTFAPGGFFGHTSGSQRWTVYPGDGSDLVRVSRRVRGDRVVWKRVGTPTSAPGGEATFGNRVPFYDHNF